jgi:hypothetical protein
MKALSLTIQKIWHMLKFQTDRQTGQKLYAPDLSIQGHKRRRLRGHFGPTLGHQFLTKKMHLSFNLVFRHLDICTHGIEKIECILT